MYSMDYGKVKVLHVLYASLICLYFDLTLWSETVKKHVFFSSIFFFSMSNFVRLFFFVSCCTVVLGSVVFAGLDPLGVWRLKAAERTMFRSVSPEMIDTALIQATGDALDRALLLKDKKIASTIKTLFASGYKSFAAAYDQQYDAFAGFWPDEIKTRRTYFRATPLADITPDVRQAFAYRYGIQKQYAGSSILLDSIPSHHHQLLTLSCESNTLRDFINFYHQQRDRKLVTEQEIVKKIPYDTTPFVTDGTTNWWGDPDVWFVGNINGLSLRLDKKHSSRWWYGIYAQPLVSILDPYIAPFGLTAYATDTISERVLIESLIAGNPIMFWYFWHDDEFLFPIMTPTGDEKTLVKWQHVGLIIGIDLDANMHITQVHFYEWLTRKLQAMSYNEFLRKTHSLKRYLLVR